MSRKRERRIVPLSKAGELRIHKRDDGTRVLTGRAIVFNEDSHDLGGFVERVAPEAISDELLERSDVRGLFNHDPNHILGRAKSGTLELRVEDDGLYYDVELPDTPTGRTVEVATERGDVDGNSFSFMLPEDDDRGQSWSQREDGTRLRTITRIAELFDVGPVTYPAYPTTAGNQFRSAEEVLADANDVLGNPQQVCSNLNEARQRALESSL